MKIPKFNHAACAVAFLAGQIIPSIWYLIFTNSWLDAIGKTADDVAPGEVGFTPFFFGIIAGAIMVYGLAILLANLEVKDWQEGIKVAVFAWFCFVLTTISVLNAFTVRPFSLTLIDGGQTLLSFAAVGAIVGGWQLKDPIAADTSSE